MDKARSYIRPPFLRGPSVSVHEVLWEQVFGFGAGSPQAAELGIRKEASGTARLKSASGPEAKTLQGLSQDSSIIITAWSKTGPRSSSTLRSPWLWAESSPDPRRLGSRPDGSRPEAAACLDQDGPQLKSILRNTAQNRSLHHCLSPVQPKCPQHADSKQRSPCCTSPSSLLLVWADASPEDLVRGPSSSVLSSPSPCVSAV